MYSIDIADTSWLIGPQAKLPVGKLESLVSSTPPMSGGSWASPTCSSRRRRGRPTTPGGTPIGHLQQPGLVFTGTPKADYNKKVSIAVDLSIAGPDQTTLNFTATGVLTGAGTADQQVRRTSCPRCSPRSAPHQDGTAVRRPAHQRGGPRLRRHHRGNHQGSNHRPRSVQVVMSSSVVLAITVLVAALGLAYVIGRLLTLRSGMLKAATNASNVDTSDLGLSGTGPTVVHFCAGGAGRAPRCAGWSTSVRRHARRGPPGDRHGRQSRSGPTAFGAVAADDVDIRRRRPAAVSHRGRAQRRRPAVGAATSLLA